MADHYSNEASAYPSRDIEAAAAAQASAEGNTRCDVPAAVVAGVMLDSPAYEAGFEAGCKILTLDGEPVRDLIDWQWRSTGDSISIGYVDNDGDAGQVTLERDECEPWGFEFEQAVFDGVKRCRNACSFCFMRQLPAGMRDSLYLRDDDYRLSFLAGTFVTLTNLSESDEQRIMEQRISPLRVSLHAADSEVRSRLIGAHAQEGLDAFERLLAAGIEAHVQIVLVPGENDGDVLCSTLEWAYEHPGILSVGIVPLGYTSHQENFTAGFDRPWQAEEVLQLIEPFQNRAVKERGHAWVYAADELYLTAYGRQVFDKLPPATFYGAFDMFEDGIGIVRTVLDEWHQAEESGLLDRVGTYLESEGLQVIMVSGFAPQAYLSLLARHKGLRERVVPFYVENRFFGGNVDVTGLLTGQDIVASLKALENMKVITSAGTRVVALPRVIFNDDGLTLDDMTLGDMASAVGFPLAVVSCSPNKYLQEFLQLSRAAL